MVSPMEHRVKKIARPIMPTVWSLHVAMAAARGAIFFLVLLLAILALFKGLAAARGVMLAATQEPQPHLLRHQPSCKKP